MSENRPDWATIKSEYITTNTSYRKLAAKYGISYKHISVQGRKDGWFQARKKYQSDVADKIVSIVANERAQRDASKLLILQKSADNMAEAILKVFDDSEQFHRFVVPDNFSVTEKVFEKFDTKSMREITASIKDLAVVMRNIYNIPTEQEERTYQLAKERLEIEKERVSNTDDNDAETGVIVIPATTEEDDG